MKKYFVLAMIVVFAATGASARSSRAARSGNGPNDGRSIHALGFAVPLQWQTWENDYNEVMDWSTFGVGIMYHHLDIRPSRFSTFMDVQMAYSGFTLDAIDGQEQDAFGELDGFNTHYVFGIGGAPVVADRLTLAVHGTFGVHLAVASGSAPLETDTYYLDSGLFAFWTTIGANVDAAWRITKRVGVFAGIDMYTNLLGGGVFWFDSSFGDYSWGCFINPGDFNVDFRVGVAFVF